MITTVLLDIDGTLVMSNQAHAEAWSQALALHGYPIASEQILPLIGMGSDRLLDRLVPGMSPDEGEGKEIADTRANIFKRQFMPSLQAAPGSRELVKRLIVEGKQVVIATSAKDEELESLKMAAGIADLVSEHTTSDEVESSKPAPDVVEAALEKAGSSRDETLMIGDTPYDVEAGRRAGVGVIAVRCGGHDADLKDAIAVFDDPRDLLDHYDESPLVK